MKDLSAETIDQIGIRAVENIRTGNKSKALKILQQHGLEEALLQNTRSTVNHKFKCPAHGARVVTPCALTQCRFWLNSDLANNCLLAYCHQQQIEALSADEIAYLYHQPIKEIRASLDDAMLTLRLNALQSDAEHDGELDRVFSYIETSKICCACGLPIPTGTAIKAGDLPLAYCSKDCQESLPQDVLNCEFKLGRPIEMIIKWAFHRFRNLPILEKTLGLKRETLIELCKRHLGRNIQSYFPKIKIQTEKLLYRKLNRNEFSKFSSALAQNTQTRTAAFGTPIFSIDRLRESLNEILT